VSLTRPWIPYHVPTAIGDELSHLEAALKGPRLSGEGQYCDKAKKYLEHYFGAKLVVMTPSCTDALEMAMILSDIRPGEEVILPSFTFSSTAAAVVLRGAVPVFVDVEEHTMNIKIESVKEALTPQTRALLPVHYAGVSADMKSLKDLARTNNLLIIEDAAQAMGSYYENTPVGTMGDLAAFSFHDTKNLTCGEGGALVVNKAEFTQRAEFIRDKGTNRRQFINGVVDKYTWVDEGSSFLMSELQAAYLWSQLQNCKAVTQTRRAIWQRYHQGLSHLQAKGVLKLPKYTADNLGNGHLFYFILNSIEDRLALQKHLLEKQITAIPHYQPLHLSPAGKKFGRIGSNMRTTESVAPCLVRLPLYTSLTKDDQDRVIDDVTRFFI
jgi:dTDP-4-amino-4,6-dideoxygalactose transaminase